MASVWMLAGSDLRQRWRSVVVLTLLVAFAGAVVLALIAGARRTDSALARFETESRSAQIEVDAGTATPRQTERFRATPGVADAAELYQLTVALPNGNFLPTAAQVDGRFGRDVDRARVVDGRLARLDAVDEVNIGESLAEQLHLEVGDRLHFISFSPDDVHSAAQGLEPHGPDVVLRIVGIVRRPLDLGGRGSAGGVLVLTPAFLERYRDEIGTFAGSVLRVRTARGAADVPRVTAAAREIFGRSDKFSFTNLSVEGASVQNAIDVTTVGLWIAAGVAVLTSVIGVGIALSREISLRDSQQLTLSALGVRPRHRIAAAAAVGVPIAMVGALLAMVGAVLASPLFPIGVAGRAEPDPGIRFDPVVVLGGLAIVLVVMGVAALAALRTSRVVVASRESTKLGLAVRATAESTAKPPAVIGVRFALDRGHERRALPVRSSLFGAAFGALIIVAVMVFSGGIHHLVSTPSEFGWTWDYIAYDTKARLASTSGDSNDCEPLTTKVTEIEGITDVASVCNASVEIAGHPTTAWGFGNIRGTVDPTIVDGRAPRADDEVALGADTLTAAHRAVGDDVHIAGADGEGDFRIVGQAAFTGLSDPAPLADGAAFTARSLARLGANGGWNVVVRVAANAHRAALVQQLQPPKGPLGGGDQVTYVLPAEIDRVQQIDDLPVVLAAFVAVVALVAVALALVSSVRRRRRELAVLKTLGFTRHQVRATVAWQASTVAMVGLLVGIPVGLVVGRLAWRAVADELGVSSTPTWPLLGIVLLVPAALLVVNLVAAVPARRAAGTRPAVVLRTE
jgi:ABC-type lipoprotein release transport system permease subunit